MRAIAVLGGTFDPIHHGHLRLACEARDGLDLDGVALLPAGTPVHRNAPVANAAQRRRMLELAIDDEPGLRVDLREVERVGPSYMVDTLQALRSELPKTSLSLILGVDAFALLDTWYQWERLLGLAHLIVADRPGSTVPETGPIGQLWARAGTEDKSRVRNEPSGAIFRLQAPLLEISSTRVRKLRRDGRSIRYLVPQTVCQFICEENLYRHG
ncbi:MAG: nicotinate-nucleotide adenylyltransferase [Gammaproteobacteria bacterium]|nr:nicotinate-nucleotide adenylyltransferase [Gammaproteobacteria bacterium]